ncbi:MAG: LacI family DNA-binding transcriptional regulator [Lachnospiraceae bacterium]
MNYSIVDVAKIAGVSKSTVSRVLNNASVSEKARAAVMNALEQTGYQPNISARTLRGMNSYVVGIIMGSAMTNLSYNIRLAAMIDTLYQYGYSVMLINKAQQPYHETTPFLFLEQHMVDGLIFLSNEEDEAMREGIKSHREIVYTGERIETDKGCRIYLGNYDYSKVLYTYLMERGHRQIITLFDAWSGQRGRQRRYDAYIDACRTFKIEPDKNVFLTVGQNQLEQGYLRTLYKKVTEQGYTAFFTESIYQASCIDNYFAKCGLRLGRDFSIVSIERESDACAQGLEYTAVVLPDREYGIQAAKMLLKIMNDSSLKYLDKKLHFEFRERNSVVDLQK